MHGIRSSVVFDVEHPTAVADINRTVVRINLEKVSVMTTSCYQDLMSDAHGAPSYHQKRDQISY